MTEVTGKIYPNGEFGIARVRRFTPEHPQEEGDTRRAELVREYLPQIGLEAMLEIEGQRAKPDPLGSSLLPISRNRAPRGSNGITREAARNVRNAAYLMEERYGKSHLTFATLTLPSLCPEEFELVAAQWSKIVQRLVDRLRRDLVNAGLPPEIVGVTEIQEKRLTRFGQFAPHLHLLWVGRLVGRSWAITTKRIDSIWQDVLENRLNRAIEINSACNLQRVRKSASGYLGKYMSKGSKAVSSIKLTSPGTTLPSAWHTISRKLLKWIAKRTIVSPEIISLVWDDCWSKDHALVGFSGFIEVEVSEGWVYICGAYGRIKSEFLGWLKSEFLGVEEGWS